MQPSPLEQLSIISKSHLKKVLRRLLKVFVRSWPGTQERWNPELASPLLAEWMLHSLARYIVPLIFFRVVESEKDSYFGQKFRVNFACQCKNFAEFSRENVWGRAQKAEVLQKIRSCGLFLVALVLGLRSLTGTLAVAVVEHHRTTNDVCECAVLVAAEQGLEH